MARPGRIAVEALLQRLNDLFARLSVRERRLAIITVVVVALFVCVAGAQSALGYLSSLDARISQLEYQIQNSHQLLAQRSIIEAQYAAVASQHSSEWSEAEIYDRLRGEIYRLAQRVPPPLAEDGRPVEITNNSGDLVKIPSLRQGTLDEGGAGYREYSIPLRIPEALFADMVDYIERLQSSPQSLRIDALDLQRDPMNMKVAASILLTRTVVDKAPDGAKGGGNREAKGMDIIVSDWTGEGCKVSGGGTRLSAEATGERGKVYMERALPGGVSYELVLDLSSTGPARLAVASGNGEEFPGAGAIEAGAGGPRRYAVVFTAPASSGRAQLRVPYITLEEPGTVLQISRIVLRPL